MALHETVSVPHSSIKESIVRILAEEGYVAAYKLDEKDKFKFISVQLKYRGDRQPVIRKLERVSKPGRRVYVGSGDIPPVLGGLGINIVSTSKGLMTGKKARKEGVGGELLCEIY
jgi:small subunit ribosomal protein S8